MGSPLRAGTWIRIWRHNEWWPGATAVLPELTVYGRSQTVKQAIPANGVAQGLRGPPVH